MGKSGLGKRKVPFISSARQGNELLRGGPRSIKRLDLIYLIPTLWANTWVRPYNHQGRITPKQSLEKFFSI